MHGVFLHVLADALGSVVVIISALLIKFVPHDPSSKKHWTVYIDPTLSLIIIIIITISAIPLFKETSLILLQSIPNHIKVDELKDKLLREVPEIDGVHELHIWRLNEQKIIASAHLKRRSFQNYMLIAEKVKQFFHSMGIHSTTMQYEYDELIEDNNNEDIPQTHHDNQQEMETKKTCLLRCTSDACNLLTCCTETALTSDAKTGDETSPTAANAESDAVQRNGPPHEHSCTRDHDAHVHVPVEQTTSTDRF